MGGGAASRKNQLSQQSPPQVIGTPPDVHSISHIMGQPGHVDVPDPHSTSGGGRPWYLQPPTAPPDLGDAGDPSLGGYNLYDSDSFICTGEHAIKLEDEVLKPIWAAIPTKNVPHDFSDTARFFAKPITNKYDLNFWADVFHIEERFINRVRPLFFTTECDPDHYNQPRLDIVAILKDGNFIRMHPDARLIASWHQGENQSLRSREQRYSQLFG